MQDWWERFDGRLAEELDALAARGLDFSVDDHELAADRVVLHGAVPAGRLGPIDVSIVYPDTFPHTRPTVYQAVGARLDRHQNPFDGNYCLIGRRSDYWRPSMTAADLLDGLPGLVQAVGEGGQALIDAEDPQGEPVTTYYPTLSNGCVLVPPWIDTIPEEVTGGCLTVRFNGPRPFPQPSLHGEPVTHFGQACCSC